MNWRYRRYSGQCTVSAFALFWGYKGMIMENEHVEPFRYISNMTIFLQLILGSDYISTTTIHGLSTSLVIHEHFFLNFFILWMCIHELVVLPIFRNNNDLRTTMTYNEIQHYLFLAWSLSRFDRAWSSFNGHKISNKRNSEWFVSFLCWYCSQ